jgi:two-component system response regulator NreC
LKVKETREQPIFLIYQYTMIRTDKPIRIILADDHEIFRDGLRVMLKKQPSIELLAEAGNGVDLIELTRKLRPDVVLTDIMMPKMDGIEATRNLLAEFPGLKIVALSMFDEENLIIDMLEAGAKGYLLKNAHKEEIVGAIRAVFADENYYCSSTSLKLAQLIARSRFSNIRTSQPELTDKEKEVVCLICLQMSNKEIAGKLNLSIRTIEGYRERIQEKIKVKNVAGLVVYAIKHKIYTPE